MIQPSSSSPPRPPRSRLRPLAARPMTATDMQSMHRLGAPDVSPDGRWAVFTLSDTDWAKNKRVNTLYLLDLTKAGAQPQPIARRREGP